MPSDDTTEEFVSNVPRAVIQRAYRVQVVFMELPVDILEGHRIDNHREEGSVGVDGGDQTKRPSAEARERTRFNSSESGS